MIKSMTGYGKGEAASEQGAFTVEIRSVNHRYGEISVRMPRSFFALESQVRSLSAARLKRGKIDISIQWEEPQTGDKTPSIDYAAAREYHTAFSVLGAELGLSEEPSLALILSQKGVLKEAGPLEEHDPDDLWPLLEKALTQAVSAIDSMRAREGQTLHSDLSERRSRVATLVGRIGGRAPAVVLEYRQKLKTRLEQLMESAAIDESRLAQEVALLADRSDITEELVRLQSHFNQFDEALRLAEPVGRKLDFLMQEMNREINTIGSKSSDSEITELVVDIKAEMEKMREQIQNIE